MLSCNLFRCCLFLWIVMFSFKSYFSRLATCKDISNAWCSWILRAKIWMVAESIASKTFQRLRCFVDTRVYVESCKLENQSQPSAFLCLILLLFLSTFFPAIRLRSQDLHVCSALLKLKNHNFLLRQILAITVLGQRSLHCVRVWVGMSANWANQ